MNIEHCEYCAHTHNTLNTCICFRFLFFFFVLCFVWIDSITYSYEENCTVIYYNLIVGRIWRLNGNFIQIKLVFVVVVDDYKAKMLFLLFASIVGYVTIVSLHFLLTSERMLNNFCNHILINCTKKKKKKKKKRTLDLYS